MNSITQREYIARFMSEIDAKSQIRTAQEEGRAEGREEGKDETKAKLLTEMRRQGYTEEQISAILKNL